MRALTIQEPWATAITLGAKRIEYRSWPTNYRGLLIIHSAKTEAHPFAFDDFDEDVTEHCLCGHILGAVELFDCVKRRGQFEWKLKNHCRLPRPIPATGKLGLWKPDTKLILDVTKQMQSLVRNALSRLPAVAN